MTTTTQTTVIPLGERDSDPLFGPLRAKLNKTLMVNWINQALFERCGHDVRRSIVFYDADGDFVTALLPSEFAALDDEKRAVFLQRLFDATPVRFWSKGLK